MGSLGGPGMGRLEQRRAQVGRRTEPSRAAKT